MATPPTLVSAQEPRYLFFITDPGEGRGKSLYCVRFPFRISSSATSEEKPYSKPDYCIRIRTADERFGARSARQGLTTGDILALRSCIGWTDKGKTYEPTELIAAGHYSAPYIPQVFGRKLKIAETEYKKKGIALTRHREDGDSPVSDSSDYSIFSEYDDIDALIRKINGNPGKYSAREIFPEEGHGHPGDNIVWAAESLPTTTPKSEGSEASLFDQKSWDLVRSKMAERKVNINYTKNYGELFTEIMKYNDSINGSTLSSSRESERKESGASSATVSVADSTSLASADSPTEKEDKEVSDEPLAKRRRVAGAFGGTVTTEMHGSGAAAKVGAAVPASRRQRWQTPATERIGPAPTETGAGALVGAAGSVERGVTSGVDVAAASGAGGASSKKGAKKRTKADIEDSKLSSPSTPGHR